MGELKIEKSLSLKEASKEFKKSTDFLRKHIRLGVIPVEMFNGKPLKPYRILYKDLERLFTVAALGSLKIEEIGKRLGRKPLKKEEFLWPE